LTLNAYYTRLIFDLVTHLNQLFIINRYYTHLFHVFVAPLSALRKVDSLPSKGLYDVPTKFSIFTFKFDMIFGTITNVVLKGWFE